MKIIFRGSVQKGSVVMGQDYIDHLFTLESCDIDCTVEKHKTARSSNQNRYYWAVIVKMLSDETGYSRDEMHEILKAKFLGCQAKVGKQYVHYSRSTITLKTNEFEDYLTEVREWASTELNCFLPLPNEVDYE